MLRYSISAGAGLMIFPVILLLDSCIFGRGLTYPRSVMPWFLDGRDPKSLNFWIPKFGEEEQLLTGTKKGSPQGFFD